MNIFEKRGKIIRLLILGIVVSYLSIIFMRVNLNLFYIVASIGLILIVTSLILLIKHWRCPKCNHLLDTRKGQNSDLLFCPHCGEKLRQSLFRFKIYTFLSHLGTASPHFFNPRSTNVNIQIFSLPSALMQSFLTEKGRFRPAFL